MSGGGGSKKKDGVIEGILGFFKGYGIEEWVVLTIPVIIIAVFFVPWELIKPAWPYVLPLLPVFTMLLFASFLGGDWMHYIQTRRFLESEYVLLELKIPDQVTQSPLAMETALNAFFYTGEPDTPMARYWEGKMRPQFSLEIASLEGEIHFFIHTRSKERNIIESQLYSQYPGLEIHEVPDYVSRIVYDRTKMNLTGIEQQLQKPDPYPINTYINFGLDKEQKEEFKIDPLNALLEYMGSLGKGEYMFWQLIIRSHDPKDSHKTDWKKQAEDEIKRIMNEAKARNLDKEGKPTGFVTLTKQEEMLIESIARNTAKKPFEAGIRELYIADIEHYNKNRSAALPTLMRTYESHLTNGFKPVFFSYTYSWQDPGGRFSEANKRELFDAYRWRSYITPPFERPYVFILSSEEIATIFHIPGKVARTPTLTRATSRRSEPPANLPL